MCHFSWGYILLMCSTLVIFVVSHVINKFDFGDFCNDSWFIALMYKNPLSCHLVLIYFDSIIHSFMLWVMLHSEIHQQIYLLHINSSPLDWCLFFSPRTFPLLNLYDTYWERHELAIFCAQPVKSPVKRLGGVAVELRVKNQNRRGAFVAEQIRIFKARRFNMPK